jgi:hypothetical protein
LLVTHGSRLMSTVTGVRVPALDGNRTSVILLAEVCTPADLATFVLSADFQTLQ